MSKEKKEWSPQKVSWCGLRTAWHKNLTVSNCFIVLFSIISLIVIIFTTQGDKRLITIILKLLCINSSLSIILLIIITCHYNADYLQTLILETTKSDDYSKGKQKKYQSILGVLDTSVLTLMIINAISLFTYINILIIKGV